MGESQEISEEDEVAESASGADRLVGDVSSPLNSEDFACGERWLDSPSGHCLASELQLPRLMELNLVCTIDTPSIQQSEPLS